jgi:hypothetical protein
MLLRTAVDTGHQAPAGHEMLMSFLATSSDAIGKATGRPAASLRLPLQSIVFLIARYAVVEEAELAEVTSAHTPLAQLEAHLVDIALRSLVLPT